MVQIRVEPKIDGVSGWFATSPDHDETIGKSFEENKALKKIKTLIL
ncbi:hypothetical protein H3S85_09605 [Bartonella sp. M0187]|nr:hypothetical protein [Bartonella apihabitans]MBI0026712.1 hypothetical protein [Bartonella apihabitans]